MELIRYNEPLETDELAFLKREESLERRQFFKISKVFMVLSFVIPFVFAWFHAAKQSEQEATASNPFSYLHYFIGVFFLLGFSGTALYISYRRTLAKVQRDIKYATKTVERCNITRKQYMPQVNSYFFYISSPIKLSIEVSEEDYHRLGSGDEVNIEYSTYSHTYLGYF